jgi:D-alanyl-lipoteichoic acid acyltransferase DltB (MBOAT superfamily)
MLFNSYEFLFAFLPVTFVVFLLLGRSSRNLALGWLIVASLVFYAWWRPINAPIISISLAVNFTLARLMQRLGAGGQQSRWRTPVLLLGIAFNIAFLGYFKYTNFLLSVYTDLSGRQFVLQHVILPLGISFITFQKIAFLIDVHSGRIESFTLRDYLLFVLFFPQLIAGPIVHYREMMPQFHSNPCRFDREALAVGLTMVCFGLVKKVVLADRIALYVTPIFNQAAAGDAVSLLPAWVAAIGFTLQLYFDFSGYSDMAAGLARCFGVRLPVNFYSPLQASSIIEFWTRWHITLTRFLTAYLYNPLLLWLTRRRFAKGLPGIGGRQRLTVGAFMQLLAGPTLLTMLISGLWHGAGYLFIIWGLMHGVYLTINHAWRMTGAKLWSDKERYARLMRPIGFALTFFVVVVSMVIFRAPTVHAAMDIFKGMFGGHGFELPQVIADKLSVLGVPRRYLPVRPGMNGTDLVSEYARLLMLLAIALIMPNTIQIMARWQPVLDARDRPANTGLLPRWFVWNPTVIWAGAMSLLAVWAIMRVGGPSEFLYWQF